jgi:hypothetical protein
MFSASKLCEHAGEFRGQHQAMGAGTEVGVVAIAVEVIGGEMPHAGGRETEK